MFHAFGGLYFEKLNNGAVRVLKRESGRDDAPVVFDATIDKDTWCSIIAGMSFYGEEDYGFYRAGHFHYGGQITETDGWSMSQHIEKRERKLLGLPEPEREAEERSDE